MGVKANIFEKEKTKKNERKKERKRERKIIVMIILKEKNIE